MSACVSQSASSPSNACGTTTFCEAQSQSRTSGYVASAEGVSSAPGRLYNPLFLYGAAGLGKTHLLQAIGHRTMDAGLKVIYLSAEQFTNQLITAIGQRRQEEFRQRYRSADVLLIDDIQFIAGKEGTQEEFFHTFNDLFESGKQIVLSSDRRASEIAKLESRLVSRFEWGLPADIQPPDTETRCAILISKAKQDTVDLPTEVAMVLAEHVPGNIRILEGALTKLADKYDEAERTAMSHDIARLATDWPD